jgi:hypothetical protein
VDAAAALADLMEISSQVEDAVALHEDGTLLAATGEATAAQALADAARNLLAGAARVRPAAEVTDVAALTSAGALFAVRGSGCVVAARTPGQPTVGLALYDLRTCLRALTEREGDSAAA